MATKVVVPALGESVIEATVGTWYKQEGDTVAAGDLLVELQTDKVDLEVNAEVGGVLVKIEKQEDQDVEIGDVLALIEPSADGAGTAAENGTGQEQAATPADSSQQAQQAEAPQQAAEDDRQPQPGAADATPVARRMAAERGVALHDISGSGRGGRVTKADVESYQPSTAQPQQATEQPAAQPQPAADQQSTDALAAALGLQAEREERIKMTRRRRTIARNLVQAQQNAAMLTTFNEIDMQAVMQLRNKRKAWFEEKFGVRLGFMSFFVKAVVAALKQFPRINAEIDGDEMLLKYHYDIGIAVGAEEGLVVPVVRDADKLSFAEIEQKIRQFGKAAQDNSLKLEDLVGGTFTITNGGVFGSMLSTPILNAPQVAILGMHNIVERPVVVDGEIVVRPIMYVALSYDHRIVDGREAVQFLYRVKELVEDPEDLLLAG